jgi:hypothetical protein
MTTGDLAQKEVDCPTAAQPYRDRQSVGDRNQLRDRSQLFVCQILIHGAQASHEVDTRQLISMPAS